MGKITKQLIKRCSSKRYIPNEDEEADDRRPYKFELVTHLFLQGEHIKSIDNVGICKNLLALYLFNNQISRIENLGGLSRLTYLYLNDNDIRRIENLDSLVNLKILKLGRNKIPIVEGLEQLTKLEQLWIEEQELPRGISLTFCPRSLYVISGNLKLLNVSGNGLKSLSYFKSLRNLEKLYAQNNSLYSLQDTVDCLCQLPHLNELKLQGNVVCKSYAFRDNVIVYSPKLSVLDDLTISETYRRSLCKWKRTISRSSCEDTRNGTLRRFLEAQIVEHPPPPVGVSSAPQLSQTDAQFKDVESDVPRKVMSTEDKETDDSKRSEST